MLFQHDANMSEIFLVDVQLYFISFYLVKCLGDSVLYYTRLGKSSTCRSGIINMQVTIDWTRVTDSNVPETVLIVADKGETTNQNFTQICEFPVPARNCSPQNTLGCSCYHSNASLTVLTIRFNAKPDISKAGFVAYFKVKDTLGPPLDVLYLHQIYGHESAKLQLNGQEHSLDYCKITIKLNTHLLVKFCTFNLSRPLMYRLLNGETLVSSAHPSHCLDDDILVEEETGYFELGYVDECQRTAAYYCEVSAISEIADCIDCTEGTIAEVIGYMCLSLGVASAFLLGICYIKSNTCPDLRFSTETDITGYDDYPEFFSKNYESPKIKPNSPSKKFQIENSESDE